MRLPYESLPAPLRGLVWLMLISGGIGTLLAVAPLFVVTDRKLLYASMSLASSATILFCGIQLRRGRREGVEIALIHNLPRSPATCCGASCACPGSQEYLSNTLRLIEHARQCSSRTRPARRINTQESSGP